MKKPTLPSRLRALAPQSKPKVHKLAATAHRLAPPAFEDYDEEPSTKLSTAFIVVFVLHLVAVGGIYAFHSIKAHRRAAEIGGRSEVVSKATPAAQPQAAPPQQVQASAAKAAAVTPSASPKTATPAPVSAAPITKTEPVPAPVQSAAKPPSTAPTAPAPAQDAAASQAKTYTVVKGDNPVTIAKRLGVSEEELLKLNGISDPKKLRIGQVLKVPAKKGAN